MGNYNRLTFEDAMQENIMRLTLPMSPKHSEEE